VKGLKPLHWILIAVGIAVVLGVSIVGAGILVTGVAAAGRLEEARAEATATQITILSSALDMYRINSGGYPTSEQGLFALIEPPPDKRGRSQPAYLDSDQVPTDAWGNPFIYRSPGVQAGRDYEIVSLGADGVEGGTGVDSDIRSWEL